MLSDLTFGPSFKVKRLLTCFGELSFWWIQICIGSLMRGSSFHDILTICLLKKVKPDFELRHHLAAVVSYCWMLYFKLQAISEQ